MRPQVLSRRRAGALLHMTCLAAPLGRGGRAFVDWLAEAGFSVWQFLPVGPTGADGSPYWVRSDAAGNPGLIDRQEMPPAAGDEQRLFLERSRDWLEDYTCFELLSRRYGGAPWWQWRPSDRDRDAQTLARLKQDAAGALGAIASEQFAFDWQWRRLREYAHARGVLLFGDLPFYVAPDSMETWAHRGQFQLAPNGAPAAVAGVPPDYFSELGQLWGNPLYDWSAMREDDFVFWRRRVRVQLDRMDILRLDHFRALAAHWAIPAGAPDARAGAWKRTPGWALLKVLREELGALPIVAEDLGVITAEVEDMRRAFGLPGMRVLQFGFDGSGTNPHLPHMHEHDSVVYTGTHDNDTTLGWYSSLDPDTARRVDLYLRVSPSGMPDALIRAALGSVGTLAVLPVPDLLGLGSEARFNTPATVKGNWSWRLPPGSLTPQLAAHYRELNRAFGRTA